MTAQPAWSPVDDTTADLLTTLNADWRPFAVRDRDTIATAIRRDAEAHGGSVSSNRVRAALSALPVFDQPSPRRVGPVYRALTLLGYIAVDGYEVSDDKAGGNAGRPVRCYRWVTA